MSVRVLPITGEDVNPLFGIEVTDAQDRFIAPNAITMAQARFKVGAYDFCIWDGDTRVGLLAVIDMAEHDDLEEGVDDPNAVYIWRLLIGAEFQGRGYGKAAIAFAEDWGRARGRTLAQIQAVEDNAAAIGIYQSCGYVLTGVKVDGEMQLQKPL